MKSNYFLTNGLYLSMNPAEQYILNQTEPFRAILLELQLLIVHTVPTAELKYKYKLPFYYYQGKPLCYLNKSKDYVDVGFYKAGSSGKYQAYMEAEGRKMVHSLRYRSLEDIQPEILEGVLREVVAYIETK